MVTDSPVVFLFVVVVGALVLGSEMGASGKDEMMCLDNQSDVSIADQQMMTSDARTMQVQVTPLLRTDSVANAISTHDSSGMRPRAFNSLMLHVTVSITNG